MQKQKTNANEFRVRDLRFRRIPRRDGTWLLYSTPRNGMPTWTFRGIHATEAALRTAAKKASQSRAIPPVRESTQERAYDAHGASSRFSGALERASIARVPE